MGAYTEFAFLVNIFSTSSYTINLITVIYSSESTNGQYLKFFSCKLSSKNIVNLVECIWEDKSVRGRGRISEGTLNPGPPRVYF